MKAWYGNAATQENDWAYHYLPKIEGDYSDQAMFVVMKDGKMKGFFMMGQNPAGGGINAGFHRAALDKLDWMVVRDLYETETVAYWKRPGISSALSTALASLSGLLAFGRNNQPLVEKLERAEMVSLSMELGLISALPPLLGSLGKPLFRGRTGILFGGGSIGAGLAFPLLVRIIGKLSGKSTPRPVTIGLTLLVLTGGMILGSVWIVAGRLSANDPEAVHTYNALEGKKR